MTYRPALVLLTLLAAVPGSPATAQVYRCEDGETTVFSDVPCSDNAELFEVQTGISVVAAADDLDEVTRQNKAFLDQRQEQLAARRKRAAALAQRAERNRQLRAAAEETRDRTIVGPVADYRSGSARPSPTDPRVEAQRQRAPQDEPERRRTLLSRSGGNQPRILR